MVVNPSAVQPIAEQLVPYHDDSEESNKKLKYLSYRASGFTITESASLTPCHLKSVRRWRVSDLEFKRLDGEGLADLRKLLCNQYLDIEFTRNFRLVMQKDFQVLYKSVTDNLLSKEEHEYLLKLRNHYTPQHLAMIKQLLSGGSIQEPFDFTRLTLTIRREREEVKITTEGGA